MHHPKTDVVLNHQLFAYVIEVSLAHLLESVANVLLHQLVCFLHQSGERAVCRVGSLGSLLGERRLFWRSRDLL